jgi:hypothetical protein
MEEGRGRMKKHLMIVQEIERLSAEIGVLERLRDEISNAEALKEENEKGGIGKLSVEEPSLAEFLEMTSKKMAVLAERLQQVTVDFREILF